MSSNTKESFKLLQLSDDSKSLSELELPEIVHQRKRKILRKTRNTSPHSRHGGHGRGSPANDTFASTSCTNFGLWIVIVMSCGWLFILSYMTAVVYSENRRLEVQISKQAASSHQVPDELQRWHETSKWLEQNQTAIITRFLEVDQRLTDIGKELAGIQEGLRKKADAESGDAIATVRQLQTNVAEFGARMKDLQLAVDALREQGLSMQKFETETKENLTALIEQQQKTRGGESSSNDETSVMLLHMIHNVTDPYSDQLTELAKNMTNVNDTLSQRTNGIDVDIRLHKVKLDELSDNFANMTSHVASIENELVKLRVAGGGSDVLPINNVKTNNSEVVRARR